MGGLGNQLYQYTAAHYLASKYKASEIVIDNGEYDSYKIRDLEIDQLLHNKAVNIENLKSNKDSIFRETYHVYQKLYRILCKNKPPQKVYKKNKKSYICTYIDCDLDVDLECDILHMYGYFVSASIALSERNSLMKELWLDENYKSNQYYEYYEMASGQSIAVSIRCASDYVKNDWPICSKEYYLSGINYIQNIRQNDNIPILIFADNIRKIKEEEWFSNYSNVTYVEGLSVCESFDLLRHCSDYVLSNSSFSWWGAFLSYSKEAIKMNPNKVFAGKSEKEDSLTFYDELTYMDYITGELIL